MSFKLYMTSVMKDERTGPFVTVIKAFLCLLSVVYAFSQSIINAAYSSGIRSKYKADIPVISVGNLTVGGTGKTPFTMFLVEKLLDVGKKPVVLIRGYGSDENKMLSDELPDVPVFSGQDRVRSAAGAYGAGCDIAVLDDGFQHKRIDRDLEIVLIDGVNGLGNGYLLPRGPLRESPAELERADILVVTKCDTISEVRKTELMSSLSKYAPDKPIVFARHKVSCLTDIARQSYPPEKLIGKKVMIVSGIGDPGYFHYLTASLGANIISEERYQDHHGYTQADVDHLSETVSLVSAEKIIVTQKDLVKMRDLDISPIKDKILVLNVKIEIIAGEEEIDVRLNSINFS